MTDDLTTLTDDEVRERHHALFWKVQEAGCPREVVLEFDALTDEFDRRRGDITARLDRAVCVLTDDAFPDEEIHDQPPGPEWGA